MMPRLHAPRRFGRAALTLALFAFSSSAAAGSADPRPTPADPASRIEARLPAVTHENRTLELSLHDWMRVLAVPGLSIAVIDDYRVAWARGYGVTTPGAEGSAVTPATIFQAASLAKPVTAVAVLRQVGQGRMALDDGINRHLRSWTLPDGESHAADAVSLRRLLAHTGGITPGGFPGYAPGEPVPGVVAVLGGVAPATNAPARVVSVPGGEVAYSGLGYTLLQLALADQRGQPFEVILDQTVLQPLGLRDSTFAASLPEALQARAARGHLGVGAPVEGGWRIHPELAAAGLWTTPSDLAALFIDVARARQGDADRLLTPDLAREALSPQAEGMGLGFVVRGDGAPGYFAHSGGNTGYFAHVEMLADTGQGIVVMSNSDAGQALASLLIAAVANEYDWPLPDRRQVVGRRAERLFAQYDRVANQRVAVAVDPAVLARYVGKYELAPGQVFDITLEGGQLRLRLGDQPQFPLLAESPSKFFLEAVDAQVTFLVDDAGRSAGLVLHQGGRDQPAPRID